MADTKISALAAASDFSSTDEFPVNEGGTSKKATGAQVLTFVRANTALYNASTASQGAGFATDTYLTGSSINIPSTGLQAKTMYRCTFHVTKTGAGTAAPVINIRYGTNGSTGDTSRGTLTFNAQSGVIDDCVFQVFATFRTVGSGTSAVLVSSGFLVNDLATTGFSTTGNGAATATSGGFDSTVANSILGISVNGGTSAAWTVSLVQTELVNLV